MITRYTVAAVAVGVLAYGLVARNVRLGKHVFKTVIHALPPEVRYTLSLLAFWPTAAFNRLFCALFPDRRRLWDRVSPAVVLGAAPFRHCDVHALFHSEGVRAVVNLCREWDWHGTSLYQQLGINQLRLKTIDYDIPTLRHGLEGARFIADAEAAGQSVYVHCKAGRGRSTAIVLCYLVLYRGMAPAEADAHIRRIRPHISKKWDSVTVRMCAAIRKRALARYLERIGAASAAGGRNKTETTLSSRPSSPLNNNGGAISGTVTPRAGGHGSRNSSPGSVASFSGDIHATNAASGINKALRDAVNKEIEDILSEPLEGGQHAELIAALGYDRDLERILAERGLISYGPASAAKEIVVHGPRLLDTAQTDLVAVLSGGHIATHESGSLSPPTPIVSGDTCESSSGGNGGVGGLKRQASATRLSRNDASKAPSPSAITIVEKTPTEISRGDHTATSVADDDGHKDESAPLRGQSRR